MSGNLHQQIVRFTLCSEIKKTTQKSPIKRSDTENKNLRLNDLPEITNPLSSKQCCPALFVRQIFPSARIRRSQSWSFRLDLLYHLCWYRTRKTSIEVSPLRYRDTKLTIRELNPETMWNIFKFLCKTISGLLEKDNKGGREMWSSKNQRVAVLIRKWAHSVESVYGKHCCMTRRCCL